MSNTTASTTTKKTNTKIISIEGNIGSGKSTLVNYLKDHFKKSGQKIVFVGEPIDIWETITDDDEAKTPILVKYYQDIKKYAFPFQMMAFITRIHLLRETIEENPDAVIICERSLYSDSQIFAKMLHSSKQIGEIEYKIYKMLFDEFIRDYPVDTFIYLRADPEKCYERVAKRSREGEDLISLEYLTQCHEYHEEWLGTAAATTTTNIVYLNGNEDLYLEEEHKLTKAYEQCIDICCCATSVSMV